LAQTLDSSQGDRKSADKLARRLALRLNIKGWRMVGLPEDLNPLNVP
jgi:hypothetical protein